MTREEAIELVELAFDAWEHQYSTGDDWSKEHEAKDMAIKALEQETVSKEVYDHEYFLRKEFELKIARLEQVINKIRAEIDEYGSIMVAYAITKDTKTDKGIEKLVSDVLKEAKEQVLDIIDKYKGESEG